MTRVQTFAIYASAALSGAVVMVLELIGTRVVGSFFGTSVYVWASLISVTLVAIAAGYAAGGMVASKNGPLRLYHPFALSGAAISLVPVLSRPILEATNGFGARMGALSSAMALFFLPIALLSMVGPLSIGLLVRDAARSGRVSGTLLAISTAGSVGGTLLLAFFLLPFVRIVHVLYFCAAAMLLTSLGAWLFLARRNKPREMGGLALCLVVALGSGVQSSESGLQGKRFQVLSETENHYGRLRVIDDKEMSIRWLVADSSLISATRLNDARPVFEYLNLMEVLIGLVPSAKRALVIGLGAGYVPRKLQEHGLEVDSIEINPGVVDAARMYFGFEPTGKVVTGDARYELRRLDEKYDLILHDCFSGGIIPAHVLTLEMMRDMRAHLNEGGVLITSFFGDLDGEDSAATKAISKTLKAVFPETKVLVPKRGVQPIDVALVASDRPIRLDPAYVEHLGSEKLQSYAAQFGDLEVALDDGAAAVATDDLNPFEMLQARKAEHYRDLMVERLGFDFFF